MDRIAAVSAARTAGAEVEIAGLEARLADREDAFHGAKALVNGMIESLIARCTEDNEVIVNIDDAEAMGWEFDEFAMELPKSARKRGKAPAPRPFLRSLSLTSALSRMQRVLIGWLLNSMRHSVTTGRQPLSRKTPALSTLSLNLRPPNLGGFAYGVLMYLGFVILLVVLLGICVLELLTACE
jgi:hypothetical protein